MPVAATRTSSPSPSGSTTSTTSTVGGAFRTARMCRPLAAGAGSPVALAPLGLGADGGVWRDPASRDGPFEQVAWRKDAIIATDQDHLADPHSSSLGLRRLRPR